jgi:hypothetical protein
MNVLLYVTVTIMLLSLLTYARLDSYRTFSGLKAGFVKYMEELERDPTNAAALHWYHSINPGSKESSPNQKTKAEGTARISFYLIVNKEQREKNPGAYQQTRELAKHLIAHLYGEEKFYKEIAEKRPNFINEMLDEVQAAADKLSDRSSLNNANAGALARLALSTPELQKAFYDMLKGIPKPFTTEAKGETHEIMSQEDSLVDTEDSTDASTESAQAHADPGYISLLDYITLQSTSKTRVYLAFPSILMAIYEDQNLVEKIIETRKALYKQVKDSPNQDEATQAFEDAFKHTGHAPNYADILNFTVTKTNPAKYE